MNMGGLDSDLEDLYRHRHGAFQVMLASVTGSVDDMPAMSCRRRSPKRCATRTDSAARVRWKGGCGESRFELLSDRQGSRELAIAEVPDVAFVDDSVDPALAAAVRALPPQRRLAIFLRYFGDLSYAEIGEVLGDRRRNGRGDSVQGASAARRGAFGNEVIA